MSFQQGLSGLSAASTQLDVIGNNVANASTVGFKAGQAQFADVYASALNGGTASNIGIGVKVAAVAQQFTQGNITATENPLDIAINGNGFFRLSDNGVISYTRNGQFTLDKDGYIVNSGNRLTGFTVDASGKLVTGSPVELNTNNLAQGGKPKLTTEVTAQLNLDSTKDAITATFDATDPETYTNASTVTVYDTLGNAHDVQTFYVKTAANTWNLYAAVDGDPIGDVAGVPVVSPGLVPQTSPVVTPTVVTGVVPAIVAPATAFSAIPAGSFSINGVSVGAIAAGADAAAQATNVANAISNAGITGVTAAVVGGAVVITNAAGTDVSIAMNGTAATATDATANQASLASQLGLTIGTETVAATTIGTLAFDAYGTLTTTTPQTIPLTVTTGAVTPFTVTFDYSGTTQYGSKYSVGTLTQDGYAPGNLASFSVEADGTLTGRYTNGQSATLGQVVLAKFANSNGLQSLGNNLWAETAASGQGVALAPDSSDLGVLQSYAVEDSNVDLTAELVNMITAQRYYQANAQTIKTQDAVMQTLVSLR